MYKFVKMLDLKACTVCFNTNVKLFNMDDGHLRYNYNTVSGLQTYPNNGMPAYLCMECCSYVHRSVKFRHRCQRAHLALQEILHKNMDINQINLQELKCKGYNIASTLSYIDLKRIHYEEVQHLEDAHNQIMMMSGLLTDLIIPVSHYSIIDKEENEDFTSNDIKVEYDPGSLWLTEDHLKLPKSDTDQDLDTYDQETSTVDDQKDDDFNNDNHDSDSEHSNYEQTLVVKNDSKKKKVDKDENMSLVEEYANIQPLTMTEARAAMEVQQMFGLGKHPCNVCGRTYVSEKRLKEHLRMHEKHISGTFFCELCKNYYKTDNLLKSHMTEKHMYKYICRKCPEVNFDRVSAKRHYLSTHYEKSRKRGKKPPRPDWLSNRGGKRKRKGVTEKATKKKKKKNKLPEDYPICSPLGQVEQYKLVLERRQTRNYIDAEYKCELCYRGFKFITTYSNHMKRHDPTISGELQCDMCKMQFKNTRQMYRHMVSMHMCKYACQLCDFITPQRHQARMHYRWHKNATYKCPYCEKEFKKPSTRGTHIRIHHPSTNICNLCGHSFISKAGLDGHRRMTHSKEEVEKSTSMRVNLKDPLYCSDCKMQFLSKEAFDTHLGSSNKHASTNLSVKSRTKKSGSDWHNRTDIVNKGARKPTCCDICGKQMSNDKETRKHYESEHPGAAYLKRYMCDVCGHTTKQYANLLVHRRKHTKEKPYSCPHCDRRFSALNSRNAHLVVHTGEKPYECPQCNRRFTQKGSVKMHIQTVHMKIPYPPWDKKNRLRRREMEACSSLDSMACLQPL